MNNVLAIDAARIRVAELVEAFKRNEADYVQATYNETQARTDFITPLLEAFGWDVHNNAGLPLAQREVIEEATVEVGEERLSKRPDYELRLARQRKLFVEAKKPSVRIDRNSASAFQTRRYGYSASLPISILTNFYQLVVYDCQLTPAETDDPRVARLLIIGYEEYLDQFDELWGLLSREAVYSGDFDRQFVVDATRRGAEQFDDFFLGQIRDWRERLAIDIYANTDGLSAEELTYAVQLFLSRIVFLRICEDREIEKYETLRRLDEANTFDALMTELRRADTFYDSGLFRLLDDERLGIRVSDETLKSIIDELYYPQSPYTFAVVETEVLGEIYEQFLGYVITVRDGSVQIVNKPEVRESGGVVPTPAYITDAIVARAVGPAILGKCPDELADMTVADICCGSGIFLLAAYRQLLDHHLDWYLVNDRDNHVGREIFEAAAGQWRLSFMEKRRILVTHIRGVDIDPNAVEVAKFSLLLKLIEDESSEALNAFVDGQKTAALPPLDDIIRCGNSLVDTNEWRTALGAMSDDLREKVNPLNWADEFPDEMARGGFNVIVGNPPYIRIQNMVTYSPEEVEFYQNQKSPYTTATQDNFDKYALFIERSTTIVQDSGRIGVIVPHKFMTIQSGTALRRLLSTSQLVEEIVHFGVKQVFGRSSTTYTCILILSQGERESVRVEKAGSLEQWRYGQPGEVVQFPVVEMREESWEFADEDTRELFARMRAAHTSTLASVAEILVGVQTSADNVFIFEPTSADDAMETCTWNGHDWQIEREILRLCLHDETLSAFVRPKPNARMIFPYEMRRNTKGVARAHLIQPDQMEARFPGCWAYLNARRGELEGRNITGGATAERQWYQFGRSQSLTKFDTPKIILPVLSIEPRYSYDEHNTLFTGGGNGPYYMVRSQDPAVVSDHFLLAVLNHPMSEAFIRSNTSPFRGGYYSHGKQFIQNLPIPIPDENERSEIETLVDELINANDEAEAARTPQERRQSERIVVDLRKSIEGRIGRAFGLADTDMDLVRAIPVPT